MKTQRHKMWGLLAAVFILFSAFRADKPVITIFMIGDSTMANKKIDGGNPERGWGMVLPGFFSEDIRIDNHAANGRSSKSFISEGRWEKVISKVKKGDYVFIQFGHNDEKTDSTRHTDPGTTFDDNLRRFVNETRAKGGIPVLFNSIVRRNFVQPKDASIAEEIFGSAIDAYGSVIYIDDRSYVVNGVLSSMGTVASGISPDDSVFIPYATGVKYLVGTNVSPTITVIAENVSNVSGVTEEITEVLATSYPNAEFTFEDAGSKMEAASASNEILTMLLMAMAAIVFVVGGIGIMNVLFVSVKERTNEIGILKAIGCSQRNILFEFLAEAAAISLIGGVLGIVASLLVTPVAQYLGVRVELTPAAFLIALLFALITGTLFGFYPAYKASKLVPVEALGAE